MFKNSASNNLNNIRSINMGMSKVNTRFHYTHPEHGKITVHAEVNKKGKAKIHGVEAGDMDIPISPAEADLGDKRNTHDFHVKTMEGHAESLGPGDWRKSMKKSEREVAIAILDKVKELYKSHKNSAHVVEEGKKELEVSKVDDTDTDDLDSKADADKDLEPDNNEPTNDSKDAIKKKKKQASDEKDGKEPSEDIQTEEDSDEDKVEKCGDMKVVKKSEKPLVAFLKKREEKFRGSK